MLSLDEALARCLALEIPLRVDDVPLQHCAGRRLGRALTASTPLPRWDSSAMDGYAVRAQDARRGEVLEVIEVIPAGVWPTRSLASGQAARIFTGAPMPQGADAIVLQEDTEEIPLHASESDVQNGERTTTEVRAQQVMIGETARVGQHIRRRGEEVAIDALLAEEGTLLTPGLLGLCAAQGLAHLPTFEPPRVALLETGAELASPGDALEGAQIYATHAFTLRPFIESVGGQLICCERVGDSADAVADRLRALSEAGVDLVITTGGVSVGDFDPLHEALTSLNATRAFWKVKMKPGKPVSVATVPRVDAPALPVMSLPGNPVSCVVSYLLFVHPLLQRASGAPHHEWGLRVIEATLNAPISKRHQRAELMRVTLSRDSHANSEGDPEWRCELTGGQSSAWISSIAYGDGLLWLPPEPVSWGAGEIVKVSLFPWTQLAERSTLPLSGHASG